MFEESNVDTSQWSRLACSKPSSTFKPPHSQSANIEIQNFSSRFFFVEMINSNDWPMNSIMVSMQDKSIDTSLRPTDLVTIHNLAYKCAAMILDTAQLNQGIERESQSLCLISRVLGQANGEDSPLWM